jgi:signal transduction histidine kinase
VDVNQAIVEVIGLTEGEAEKSGVSVQTQLQEQLPIIEGDKVQLQQVILNLTMNAIEAMSAVDGGPKAVLISTVNSESDGVVVAVRDSGLGLDPANIERIFNAFYTTKADGLGMGLSICRSIVEAHGGKLWATPGAPRGAVFQFTLPAEQDQHVAV